MFGKYKWNNLAHSLSSPTRHAAANPRTVNTSVEVIVNESSPPQSPRIAPPAQSPPTNRSRRVTPSPSSQRRGFGFHQDPRKPWQYYLDSGRRELLEIMNRDQLEQRTFSSESSSHSSGSKQDPSTSLQVTLEALSRRSSPLSDNESEDDDANLHGHDYFLCPEGITRKPFTDFGFDWQKSARLSSIYQSTNISPNANPYQKIAESNKSPVSSSSSSSSPSSNCAKRSKKLRAKHRRNGVHVEYSPTPANSPLLQREHSMH